MSNMLKWCEEEANYFKFQSLSDWILSLLSTKVNIDYTSDLERVKHKKRIQDEAEV